MFVSTRPEWRPADHGLHVDRLAFQRITAPAVEPVSLAEAKDHMRVVEADEDGYIGTLVAAVRSHVEEETSRALITQTWTRWIDRFPFGHMEQILLPRPPLQSVTQIVVTTDTGDVVVDTSVYNVDTHSLPGRVTLAPGGEWPVPADQPNAVAIEYVAGYGATAGDVPEDLRHAIKLGVSQLYEHREPEIVGTVVARLTKSMDWLLDPFRVTWF